MHEKPYLVPKMPVMITTKLYGTRVWYSILQYGIVYYRILQCVIVYYCALWCIMLSSVFVAARQSSAEECFSRQITDPRVTKSRREVVVLVEATGVQQCHCRISSIVVSVIIRCRGFPFSLIPAWLRHAADTDIYVYKLRDTVICSAWNSNP